MGVITSILLTVLLVANPSHSDVDEARARLAKLIAELQQQQQPPAEIAITWSTADVAVESPKFYLMTSANCPSCPAGKRNATAAGIEYEEIGVSQARSLGLLKAGQRALVPQLFCSQDPADPIVGAQATSKMKSWSEKFTGTQEAVTTATVMSEDPSLELIVECLAAHLSDEEELPASSSLLRKTVTKPAFVSRMISQLMAGNTINVADTGATISWPGDNRTIRFVSRERIAIEPPIKVSIKKLGIGLTTTLNFLKIADAGKEITLGLKGPNFTIRFDDDASKN